MSLRHRGGSPACWSCSPCSCSTGCRIDDPVGALSVHLVNGVFGTLAVGLFADKSVAAAIGTDSEALRNGLFVGGGFGQLGAQALGVVAVGACTFAAALLVLGRHQGDDGHPCQPRRGDTRPGHRRARHGGLRRLPDLHQRLREGAHETDHRIHPARQAQRREAGALQAGDLQDVGHQRPRLRPAEGLHETLPRRPTRR